MFPMKNSKVFVHVVRRLLPWPSSVLVHSGVVTSHLSCGLIPPLLSLVLSRGDIAYHFTNSLTLKRASLSAHDL